MNNARRLTLIDRRDTLSPAEAAELEQLQAEHGAYLDKIQPLPFDRLQELEAEAQRKSRP